ncbi:hypothetical protein [Aquabacterium sp.]|nr:hypothetical protein [Aquabacterium sp.]HSW07964.1 hypothetical protein [Aquabacterium sp.]
MSAVLTGRALPAVRALGVVANAVQQRHGQQYGQRWHGESPA